MKKRKHQSGSAVCGVRKMTTAFFVLLAFLILGTGFAQAQPSLTFSPLASRGTDFHSMAFSESGDLFLIGWEAGLEKIPASALPEPSSDQIQTIVSMGQYLPFFQTDVVEVIDVNGAGIAFNASGQVISFIWAAGRKATGEDIYRMGFTRCNQDGSGFTRIPLVSGISLPDLSIAAGDEFGNIPGWSGPNQMVLTSINGQETLLFTMYGVPGILQAPAAGGTVTYFRQFEEGAHVWTLAAMERLGTKKLLYAFTGDDAIYAIDAAGTAAPVPLVTRSEVITLFAQKFGSVIDQQNNRPRFIDAVYEPVSDLIFFVAELWDTAVPSTLFAVTPDGSSVSRVIDGAEMIAPLAQFRAPDGPYFLINTISTRPGTIESGKKSLFLGDFWSNLRTVRLDLDGGANAASEYVGGIPVSSFNSAGNKTAFLSVLDDVDQYIAAGNTHAAVSQLTNLRKRINGCGSRPDNNDWIRTCAEQVKARSLINILIGELD